MNELREKQTKKQTTQNYIKNKITKIKNKITKIKNKITKIKNNITKITFQEGVHDT